MTPAEAQPAAPGAAPAPPPETITGAVLALADVDAARPGGERPPSHPRRGGGPGRGAGGLAARHTPRRPLPRRRHARQRARVRLLARGGGAGRRRGGRGQPDAPRGRAGAGPLAHRVPVPHHGLRPTCPWWRAPASATRSARSGAHNERVLVLDTKAARDTSAPYARRRAGRRRRTLGDPRDPRLSPLHLGHLRRTQGLPVQPGPAGPHRSHRGADVRARRRRTSATSPCRCSTPTR